MSTNTEFNLFPFAMVIFPKFPCVNLVKFCFVDCTCRVQPKSTMYVFSFFVCVWLTKDGSLSEIFSAGIRGTTDSFFSSIMVFLLKQKLDDLSLFFFHDFCCCSNCFYNCCYCYNLCFYYNHFFENLFFILFFNLKQSEWEILKFAIQAKFFSLITFICYFVCCIFRTRTSISVFRTMCEFID